MPSTSGREPNPGVRHWHRGNCGGNGSVGGPVPVSGRTEGCVVSPTCPRSRGAPHAARCSSRAPSMARRRTQMPRRVSTRACTHGARRTCTSLPCGILPRLDRQTRRALTQHFGILLHCCLTLVLCKLRASAEHGALQFSSPRRQGMALSRCGARRRRRGCQYESKGRPRRNGQCHTACELFQRSSEYHETPLYWAWV